MAVFFTNVCKFQNCGIIFPTLYNLIEHIEEFHIDFDAKIYEENFASYQSLPLSKVLKYSSCRRVKNAPVYNQKKFNLTKKSTICKAEKYTWTKSTEDDEVLNVLDDTPTTSFNNVSNSYSSSGSSSSSSSLSNSPFNGYLDNIQKIANYYNMVDSMAFEILKNDGKAITAKKPYSCTVPGCSKSYKHSNGIRYHKKFGHCSFDTKSKTNRKQMHFRNSTTFNNDLKYNYFTSMYKPTEEFSFDMDARNRNISEHGYSTPYFNSPMLPPYFVKTKAPYYG